MHSSFFEILLPLTFGGFFLGLLMLAAGAILLFVFTIVGAAMEKDFTTCKKVATALTFYGSILSAISFGTCAVVGTLGSR